MDNFAFLDLSMPDLLILLFGIAFVAAVVLIARIVYKGFIRGYLAKK